MSTSKATPEVVDTADTSPRQEAAKGEKVRAIPFAHGTTVIIRAQDFKTAGNIEHPDVTWDFRVNDFCATVGENISKEAADFLTKNYPDSFQYVTS